MLRAVAIVIALFLVATGLMFGCTRINAGHVGIVIELAGSKRGAQDYHATTGWVFYNRFGTQVVEYPTFVQTAKWTHSPHEGDNPESPKNANEEISFNDSEGLNVNADISLSYHLIEEKITAFYVKFRSDDIVNFTHGFLRNEARNAFNDVGGDYRVEEIIGPKKEKFMSEVQKKLQARVSDIGVVIDQLGFIESPRPPRAVMDAINAKVQATQLALQKQNELVTAQAEANKVAAYADGDARAAVARAKGQAEANRLISESLTDKVLERTRLDLQWHIADRWNGQPTQFVSGSGTGSGGAILFQMPQPSKKEN